MNIVISEFMDEAAVEQLAAEFSVCYERDLADDRNRLCAAVDAADALIVRNRTQVNVALLEHATTLRVVGRLGVGLDNIDVDACKARGIEVIAATGANALSVAEYVVCTAMMLLRGAYASSVEVAAGKWPRAQLSQGRETSGKVLGVIGFGAIGRLAAAMARSLGMRVLAHDLALTADDAVWSQQKVEPLSLDQLLAEADVVSLHVPLSASTRGLFDAKRIASMKRGACLINTARGGIVDEAALAAALKSGHLAGAALDVFEHEPLTAGSALADCPNLLLTPHVAGVTRESSERVGALIAERVAGALRRSK
ncbi:MAG: hydroxyacid dehydrogenase [Burkholderiaceae bacterium]